MFELKKKSQDTKLLLMFYYLTRLRFKNFSLSLSTFDTVKERLKNFNLFEESTFLSSVTDDKFCFFFFLNIRVQTHYDLFHVISRLACLPFLEAIMILHERTWFARNSSVFYLYSLKCWTFFILLHRKSK